MTTTGAFQGGQFPSAVILRAVRWSLMFPISDRELERMLQDRDTAVDHTTILCGIQADAPALEKKIRPHLRMTTGSWQVDETSVKVKERWMSLYRAVDSRGQTLNFRLSAKRDAAAAKHFFRQALKRGHTVTPRTLTVDKNAADPKATRAMMRDDELWRFAQLRPVKYLNNIVEQDHRRIKRPVHPGLGFGGFWTAQRTLIGYEAMSMIRKGQLRDVPGNDMGTQATTVIASLFATAA
jgi:transposase, IS6 family